MNPAAILALISNLYDQVAALTAENRQLREALASRPPADPTSQGGDTHE